MPTAAAAAQAAPGVLQVVVAVVDSALHLEQPMAFQTTVHRLAALRAEPPEQMVVGVLGAVRAVLEAPMVQRQQPLVAVLFEQARAVVAAVVLVPATLRGQVAQGGLKLAYLAVVERMERQRLHLALLVHRVKVVAVVDRTPVRQAGLVARAACPAAVAAVERQLPGLIRVPVGLAATVK